MTDSRKINPDLQRERDNCTFDVTELTYLIDGGAQKTEERRKREEMVLKEGIHIEEVPSVYLSHKDKYELAVKKACYLFKMIRRLQEEENTGMENYQEVLGGSLGSAILGDGSPLTLHYVMFIPTIMGQASVEQQVHWLGRAFNCDIIGTYAQTELGHGTFIRGLETTATYDPSTKEFVLHSPTLTSYKWWPGGLAHTANYCIVVAQLYTNGKCHGIHPFIVQLRDEETHMPLPGIKIGEIGAKLGMNGTNNGFLGFDKVRIPREYMLMKNSKVLEDGTYVNAPSSKLTYGTMMFVRVVLVNDMCNYMAKAVTIATRYSAVRHQSQPKPNEPEPQILEYVTQQHKLLIGIATVHALRLSGSWMWNMYNNVTAELESGDLDRLPELHALSCCLKAVSTADAAECVERCRLACGGHGYMLSSSLPLMYGMVTAACTYEGENTVLHLQTARYLVKAWQQAMGGHALTPTVAYIGRVSAGRRSPPWENTIQGIIEGFQRVAAGKIAQCVANIEKRQKSGMTYEDAWNMTSVQLTAASEAHCRAFILSTYFEETENLVKTASPALRQVLLQLADLYVVFWALQRVGDLLRFTSISEREIEQLQAWYEDLLIKLRVNAVGLVDAFDIKDEVKEDELPKSLCNSCFNLLTKFSDFKKTCMQSENILQGIVHDLSKSIKSESFEENYAELKTKLYRSTSEEKQESVRVKAEELNDTDILGADLDDDNEVYDDSNSTIRRVKKPIKIKKRFTKTILKPHQLKKRFNFTCELCNKKFGFRERFEAHMLEHEGKSTSIYCVPCNKTFTTWGGLKRHNDCEHTNLSLEQLTCKLCSKLFKSPRTLKIHYATHGDRKLKICDVCGKGFKSDLTLKAHLETHIENRERRYTCQHCGKKYLSKKTCASHASRRHSDKRFICHHCNYPFTDKSNLAKHILIHEGKQQLHKCDLCLKTYSSQSALVIHKRVHTGERPFLCNYCPKSFSNRRMLVDHQRIHTGEKPHKCLVCEQSFTQRGTMKRHMKVHDRLCT